MSNFFKDINQVEDVRATIHISSNGQVLSREANAGYEAIVAGLNWTPMSVLLQNVMDLELLYDRMRVYIRKAPSGFLIVIMGRYANMSMVRLETDVLLPLLSSKPQKKPKGLGRFFRSNPT